MITQEQLLKMLTEIESDQIERTESVNNTEKFCQAICAFANDLPNHHEPGYLLIGVKDNGVLSGLTVTDNLLKNLGGIRSDGNILPQPHIIIDKFSFSEGDVAVIEVYPSDLPPVRYNGRVYIRVGPRKAIANEQEERILSERRSSLINTFDSQPVRESEISDISLRLFEDYREATIDPEIIKENHRTKEERLASLRCYDLRANKPTVAGILLFANNPRYYLPGAYVQFLKFPGKTMTDIPIDQQEVSGDLRSILEGIRIKITGYNIVGMEKSDGFREHLLPDYPEWAVRELFHNAIMHRNYSSTSPIRFYWFSDRIEIQNPGGLYGEVTPETLTRRNSYRNPVIAESLKSMGYINKFGYGIQRAQSMLIENGNPPAEFEIDDKVFCVTIRKSITSK
jgi:ATP-dependent DNA helicase RecG